MTFWLESVFTLNVIHNLNIITSIRSLKAQVTNHVFRIRFFTCNNDLGTLEVKSFLSFWKKYRYIIVIKNDKIFPAICNSQVQGQVSLFCSDFRRRNRMGCSLLSLEG